MVHSLALGQINTPNVLPLLKKEIAVAFINGISLNVSLGIIVLLWLKQPLLSLVIGSALTINLCTAALRGESSSQ